MEPMIADDLCLCSNFVCKNHDLEKKGESLPLQDGNNKESTTSSAASIPSSGRLTLEQLIKYECMHGHELVGYHSLDSAKIRKIIANRLSAQRCRNKKVQHLREMEKKVNDLQVIVSLLYPEIEHYKEKQNVLMVQNSLLHQSLNSFTRKSELLKVEIEAMQVEAYRLRELYEAQKKQEKFIGKEEEEVPQDMWGMTDQHWSSI
ncbi:unnamed protein product [Cuscuta europaea]|uniref:BZIP domain-containing protein n=1 Tax=Cuscuta europaea TaxID=41803 RepID=A0A9P0YS05_CUSEU|nr:unnamed protein product [Cuscuta europaea]